MFKITKKIEGNPKGKHLWILVVIDPDDVEDSTTNLWQADTEDELYDLVKQVYVEKDDEVFSAKFDVDWGFLFLHTLIGKKSVCKHEYKDLTFIRDRQIKCKCGQFFSY